MAKRSKPAWLKSLARPGRPARIALVTSFCGPARLRGADNSPQSTWIEIEINVGDEDEEACATLHQRRSRVLSVRNLYQPPVGNA
jgi:hypothetical protein